MKPSVFTFRGNGLHPTDDAICGELNRLRESDLAQGRIYPGLDRIREVSIAIGVAVADLAFRRGLTEMKRPADLTRHVKAIVYDPRYVDHCAAIDAREPLATG